MITFEDILPTLNDLFIDKLPVYIEEINKIHNDGLIIYPFENKSVLENCPKLPCFKFELLEAEYSEKDRIVENEKFDFIIEIRTKTTDNTKIIEFCRYEKAIENLLTENEILFLRIKILYFKDNLIKLRIIIWWIILRNYS